MTIPFNWKPMCHTCRTAKKDLESKSTGLKAIDIIKKPLSKGVVRLLIRRYGMGNMIQETAKTTTRLGSER
jgi:arsenate reductase-like glutaredoxin family protein